MSSDLFIHGDSSSSSSSLFSDLPFPSDTDFQFLSHSYSPDFSDPNIYLLQHYNPNQTANGFQNSSNFEESHQNSFNYPLQQLCFNPSDNIAGDDKSLLHRSFSEKPTFKSSLESLLMEPPNFPWPESEFFSSQLRRVFSAGDLQDSGKVGRYSADERKERILKYRAKRTQRNFNKTIKYACRKTLADNRPRVRGRFARNDEPGEIPKAACSFGEEDELDFWMEELHEGGEEETVKGKQYNEVYEQIQFQYCGF